MQHYDILIATPGINFEVQYIKSLVKTLEECNKRGLTYKWLNNYSSLVHHARELTASGSEDRILDPMQTKPGGNEITYNKIFWIDSDISWETEDFFKLYDSEDDIVSGIYLLADGFQTSVHMFGENKSISPLEILNKKDKIKVQSIGFGFVAIKSGVFEKIKRPWFSLQLVKVGESIDGEDVVDSIGEDISWCIKAKDAGFDCYLDPTVKVSHIKRVAISWNHIYAMAEGKIPAQK